jgi:hypothetical protein
MVFDEGPGPRGMSDRSNDRLSARVEMDVLHNDPLLSATAKFSQRVHLQGKDFC